MISVDALLFDLDGTLLDTRRDLAFSVQHLQRHYGAKTNSEDEVAAFIGDGVIKLVQRALPKLPSAHLDEAVVQFKKFYRAHCLDNTRVYPGVPETLKHFRRKDLAVVTNKPGRISAYLLESLDLSQYFKVLVGGDSLPHKKPHPEPILNTLKTLGIFELKKVAVVGDGPNDVLAGRAAGVLTCGIKSNIGDFNKLQKTRPDFMIGNMKELMRIFR